MPDPLQVYSTPNYSWGVSLRISTKTGPEPVHLRPHKGPSQETTAAAQRLLHIESNLFGLISKSFNFEKVLYFGKVRFEGVLSSFWIHVSQTREGFNSPLRPSFRRGSNSNQTRNRGSRLYDGMNPTPSSDWRWILVCLMVWVADLTPHLYGWHES